MLWEINSRGKTPLEDLTDTIFTGFLLGCSLVGFVIVQGTEFLVSLKDAVLSK